MNRIERVKKRIDSTDAMDNHYLVHNNDVRHLIAEMDQQAKEIERLRNYLETLRSNTPYGLYQQQITEVLQDAGEWPCTCGKCDGEHFGMAIKSFDGEGVNK